MLGSTWVNLVSFAAVLRLVTQHSSPEECCVTSLKTAAKETKVNRVCSTVALPMLFVNVTGRHFLQLRTQRSSESTLRFSFKKRQLCVTKFILVDPRNLQTINGLRFMRRKSAPWPSACRTLSFCQKCLCCKV